MPRLMFRYRLYPSKTQMKVLEEQLEICRGLHNWLLLYAKGYYKDTGKTISQFTMQNLLPKLKADRPELLKVHSRARARAQACLVSYTPLGILFSELLERARKKGYLIK